MSVEVCIIRGCGLFPLTRLDPWCWCLQELTDIMDFLWIIVFVDFILMLFLCYVALISRFLCNAPMLMSSDNWALHYFVVLTQNKMVSVMTFRLQNWELKIRHWHFIFYTGRERTKGDLQINLQIHLQLWAHPCRFVSGVTSKWI